MDKKQQYCTFYLNGEYFGIEVEKVQEVIKEQPFTTVPLAPSTIKGLINLRGQIIAVIDLRARLECPPFLGNIANRMIIILKHKEYFVGFLVDKIGEVWAVDVDDFHSVPETLRGVAREMITGTFKRDEGLLKILNTEKTNDFRVAI